MTRRISKKTTPIFAICILACCSMIQLSLAFVIRSKPIGMSSSKTSATTEHVTFGNPTVDGDGNAANVLLETLEKRLMRGSLIGKEQFDAALSASDSLLEQLDEIESENKLKLYNAASQLDMGTVSKMLEAGLEMDEATTDAAFWAVVDSVDDAEARDLPLSADVAVMLHHIFEADHKNLLTRDKLSTNLTCMQPDDSNGLEGASRKMNYVFDDGDHKNLPLTEGRRCEGGNCCDKCSRNIFPTFASDAECSLTTFPELSALTFNALETVSSATIIQFVRLIERVRRTIAYEYGLPLKTILPLQAYSRKYVAGTTQQGGGGGEGDFVILHTDEATHDGYHYSCVLYLSTSGVDFEGGAFVFNDPAPKDGSEGNVEATTTKNAMDEDDEDFIDEELLEALRNGELPDKPLAFENEDKGCIEEDIRRAGRVLTPFNPTRGAAVIFSSGWENMHEVEKITSGVRYAVPCFFTTCPVPEAAYDQMKVGKPKTNEDIADDWLHLLLAHRKEEPMESVGRVKELLMKWHYMCTPLSEH